MNIIKKIPFNLVASACFLIMAIIVFTDLFQRNFYPVIFYLLPLSYLILGINCMNNSKSISFMISILVIIVLTIDDMMINYNSLSYNMSDGEIVIGADLTNLLIASIFYILIYGFVLIKTKFDFTVKDNVAIICNCIVSIIAIILLFLLQQFRLDVFLGFNFSHFDNLRAMIGHIFRMFILTMSIISLFAYMTFNARVYKIDLKDIALFSFNNTPNKKVDIEDELRKYKSLLDDNIITEDEFNKKKKELLDL